MAAYGVVKRIDQFPLNVAMGLCQGFMPLVGYNFSSGDDERMRHVSVFSWKAISSFLSERQARWGRLSCALFTACNDIHSPNLNVSTTKPMETSLYPGRGYNKSIR